VGYGGGVRRVDGEMAAERLPGDATPASLTELNELCLALLAEQSGVRGSQAGGLLRLIADSWRTMDAAARRRAAACPFLLVDAGFSDPLRWQAPPAPQVGDASEGTYAAFFTVPGTAHVARLVFTYAWHLARTDGPAARVYLAMPADTATAIARWTLPQINGLADCHRGWLTPRWPARVLFWRELLAAAGCGDSSALEHSRLRGIALLAAEARMRAPRVRV
jgi:hypothetical protein